MQVSKTATIKDTEYVVRELTIGEIIELFENTTTKAEDFRKVGTTDAAASEFLKKEIQVLLNIAMEGDHELKDFYKMKPSEAKLIYNAFKEANKVFFDIAVQMGLEGILQGVKDSIRKDFSVVLASSSKAAMSKSLNTVTPTS